MSSDASDNTMRADVGDLVEQLDQALTCVIGLDMAAHNRSRLRSALMHAQAFIADQPRQVAEAVAAEQKAMDRMLQVAGLGLPMRGAVYTALAHVRNRLAERSTL